MTNDRYLIVSYFICAVFAGALGLFVYLLLRRSFSDLAGAASESRLRETLSRLFLVGLLLPPLLGFISVSYRGCNRTSYESIVQDRSYLVQKNHEQFSSAMLFLTVAVLFWSIVILLVVKFGRKAGNLSSLSSNE